MEFHWFINVTAGKNKGLEGNIIKRPHCYFIQPLFGMCSIGRNNSNLAYADSKKAKVSSHRKPFRS
jgi:hypothetical protein